MFSLFEASVLTRPWSIVSSWRSRSSERSTIVTLAPMPSAICAAFVPTTPPPMTTTSAPAHRGCRRAAFRCRRAPSRGSGRRPGPPSGPRPRSSASAAAGARCQAEPFRRPPPARGSNQRPGQRLVGGEVEIGEEDLLGRRKSYSAGTGSLTLTIISARAKTSAAVDQLGAGGGVLGVGEAAPLARRALDQDLMSPRARYSRTPAGVTDTRNSWSLTSLGTPMSMTSRPCPGSA